MRYQLKTPYRDGTTFVVFEPLDFIARLVALIPRPRANLTRYHGVFAPNSNDRGLITPGKRGRGGLRRLRVDASDQTAEEKRRGMTWAQRLKRVFAIDVERCSNCGGKARIIACVNEPAAISVILAHLERTGRLQGEAALGRTGGGSLAAGRAPPGSDLRSGLFD